MTPAAIHPEILPDIQTSVLAQLGSVVDSDGFYLGGGTAVALHLGHRRSIDLDWFISGDFGDALRYAEHLRQRGVGLQIRDTSRGTLHAMVDGVKISFLTYNYPLLEATPTMPQFSCNLASTRDLACMKLAALAQRGAKKDFVDIYSLLNDGRHLADMLADYQSKYGIDDVGHVVMSLTYFDDADAEPMPMMLATCDWETVKNDLRRRIEAFVRQ